MVPARVGNTTEHRKGIVMKNIFLSLAAATALLFGTLATPTSAEARPWGYRSGAYYGPSYGYRSGGYGYRPYYGGYSTYSYGYRPYYGNSYYGNSYYGGSYYGGYPYGSYYRGYPSYGNYYRAPAYYYGTPGYSGYYSTPGANYGPRTAMGGGVYIY
jgi:hypothetical protein